MNLFHSYSIVWFYYEIITGTFNNTKPYVYFSYLLNLIFNCVHGICSEQDLEVSLMSHFDANLQVSAFSIAGIEKVKIPEMKKLWVSVRLNEEIFKLAK